MGNRFKSIVLYVAAMAVMLYGIIAMLGRGVCLEDGIALIVWAASYGVLLAGWVYYDQRGEAQ